MLLTFLYFFGIILGLLRDRSRLISLYQIVIVWIAYAFNTSNPDMETYRLIFYGYYGRVHEPGFDYLCEFFLNNGFTFEVFWETIATVIVFLFFSAIYGLYHDRHNGAKSLIMLVPLLRMVITLRNSISLTIVICAMVWYFRCNSKQIKNKIIVGLLVVIAALFHYSALFFLVVLFIKEELPSKKVLFKVFLIVSIATIGVNTPLFGIVLNKLFHSSKVLDWFSNSNRIGAGLIIIWGLQLIGFYIVFYIYKCRNLLIDKCDIKEVSITKKIFSLNVYSMFLMGFYTFNMEFYSRIYIIVMMINTIDIIHFWSKNKKNKYTLLGLLMHTTYIIINFLFLYGIGAIDVLKYNSLIS